MVLPAVRVALNPILTYLLLARLSLRTLTNVNQELPPSFHLVYANAFADIILAMHFMISSILTLVGHSPSGAFCYVLSFLGQVGGQSSSCWTAVICINLLCMLVEPVTYGRRQAEYFPYYHAGVWSLNLVIWVTAALDGGVGKVRVTKLLQFPA